jgi:sulfite exporter TauE/SafE
VSHRVPAAYALLGICGREAGWHTREVAEATRSPRGHAAIVAGAKLLAMTAIDVLASTELREASRREHEEALANA